MAVEILMPELGESVHEGTVSKWLKKEGDFVKEDEPVVEIMTDKVNTELQAPASGILSQILVQEGGTVEVFKPMGLIEESTTAAAAPPKKELPVDEDANGKKTPPKEEPAAAQTATPSPQPLAAGERQWFSPL